MDGHAVKVYGILRDMDLPKDTLSDCRGIAQRAQDNWRAWFKTNRTKVERQQEKIDRLKKGTDRAALKIDRPKKKESMYTAPSLLRAPQPLKKVLSGDQYAAFLVRLEKLKKKLHQPKSPSPRAPGTPKP